MSHSEQTDEFLRALSRLSGWLYFLAWSLSFYPQPILNFRRKTTQGLTPDFPLLNVFGFACYTTSTTLFLFSPTIRSQYASRHPLSPEPTVRINDLAFGVHAVLLCVIVYSQLWPQLWGWPRQPKQGVAVQRRAGRVTLGLLWGVLLAVGLVLGVVVVGGEAGGTRAGGWGWIDVVYALTYTKLLLTVFKYIPQAVSNYQRKSTLGWSITQQLLDFSGGVLSLAQLVLDASLQADWSGLMGNPVKFGLANISLVFDLVFIVQHFVLYGAVAEGEGGKDGERGEAGEALLGGRREGGRLRE